MFYNTAMVGFHTEFNGDAIMLGVLRACPVKIMILEVMFLLNKF